jgi:hypothetical protein
VTPAAGQPSGGAALLRSLTRLLKAGVPPDVALALVKMREQIDKEREVR